MNATIYCKTFTKLSIVVWLICFIFPDSDYFIGLNSIFKFFTAKPYHKHFRKRHSVKKDARNGKYHRANTKEKNISGEVRSNKFIVVSFH